MVVLGVGVGLCMPVPTVVVQSTVDYSDLGVATSGVSFLRTMGSSFGVAVFGSIYAHQLPEKLAPAVQSAQVDPRLATTVEGVRSLAGSGSLVDHRRVRRRTARRLPLGRTGRRAGLPHRVDAQAGSAPRHRPDGRRRTSATSFAAPSSFDSEHELAKLAALVVQHHKRNPAPEVLAESGLPLTTAQAWLIMRVFRGGRETGAATLAAITADLKMPPGVVEPLATQLVAAGYLSETLGQYRFTPAGLEMFQRFVGAFRTWIRTRLAEWDPENSEAFAAAVDRLATQMIDQGQSLTTGKHAAALTPV